MIAMTLIATSLFYSCGNANKNSNTPIEDSASSSKVSKNLNRTRPVKDTSLTAFARFISGLNDPHFVFKNTGTLAWKNYSKSNESLWNGLESKLANPIKSWVSHLKKVEPTPKTLFYPFAGGDFYYANLFFPGVDSIIMLGLEPTGSLFNPDQTSDEFINHYYNNLQFSMFFPHKLGFFRTKSMKKDFEKGPLNGTLHTVLFYIARSGYQIANIIFFNLDKNGEMIDLTSAEKAKNENFIGYQIQYFDSTQSLKNLIYISYDVSDGNLKSKPGLMNWLNKKQKINCFFKAASYLMHYDQFSMVRNYVITHATQIIQDDSGVPYKILLAGRYQVNLYGKYTRTINLFKDEFQPDLKDAYEKESREKIPFLIGYNAEFGECNLQHAIKMKK